MLGKSLVVAEVQGGNVAACTLSAITAAAKCGPVSALVAGADAAAAAQTLAKVQGVEEVFVANGAHYSNGLPEELAPLVVETTQKNGFTHVFAGTSALGKNVIPRAAAKLDSMPISDITGVSDEATFVRLTYAGNAVTSVKSSDKIICATVRGTSFERAAEGGSAKVTEVADTAVVGTSKWVEDLVEKTDKPDLSTAATVISGGRGLKNGDNFKLLDELAAPLKAAVGATRAVVDAGYVANDMQIGQTGKVVAPELYIAVGLSGAIQHVAGMKDSKVIACINNDADAPIFTVSDYGLVADLFEAVPKMTELLKK